MSNIATSETILKSYFKIFDTDKPILDKMATLSNIVKCSENLLKEYQSEFERANNSPERKKQIAELQEKLQRLKSE